MNRWVRLFAPVFALALVLAAGYAALGQGAANAQVPANTTSSVWVVKPSAPKAPVTQATSAPAPTAAPQSGNGSNEAAGTEQQDGATETGTETSDGTAAGAETNDGAEPADNEAAEAAALASQAKITVDQAKAAALAANPGATVTKAELGDENGTVIYSVELNNGDDVKVDAQSGAIIGTDKAEAEGTQDTETNDGVDQQNTTQQ